MKTKSLRKLCIAVAVTIALAIACAGTFYGVNADNAVAAEVPECRSASTEVLTYVDVFSSYYGQAAAIVSEEGRDICSFEDFCDGYYCREMNLPDYTDAVVRNALYGEEVGQAAEDVITRASNDADYILSATDYATTPASEFRRTPVYDVYDYSILREGDIVYETDTILFDAGHDAIIYDMSKSGAYGSYIQTVEAVGGGVQYGFLDDTRIVDFGVKILRVAGATDSVVEQAKYFCYEQIGKSYFLNILRLNTSIDSTSWYCSELMYAAYKYAGIDIGVKKNASGGDVYLSLGCIPSDIYNSYNTTEIPLRYVSQHYFLDISIVGKTGGDWTIQVYNSGNKDITVEYNSKMCFKGDAQKWTGLKHINLAVVIARASVNVVVSENAAATSVVFSWVDQGKRMITYGYRLNKNDRSMTVEHSIV